MRFDIMMQGVACSIMSIGVAGMMYMKSSSEEKMKIDKGGFYETITKEPVKQWYKLNAEGNWIQLKPEVEAKVQEAYESGEDETEMGKYIVHMNAERGGWKYWLENTEKESFTKIKFEEA